MVTTWNYFLNRREQRVVVCPLLPPVQMLCLGFVVLAVMESLACAEEPNIEVEAALFDSGAGQLPFYLETAREYEKLRPGIKINLYGDPRIAAKNRIRALESTFPAITDLGPDYWTLIRNGDILPLDEFLDGPSWEGDSTWRESFLPGALDLYRHQGKTYGLPLPYYANTCWYNKKLFREHGWSKPTTWDQFFNLCAQIRGAGIAPLAFPGRYPASSKIIAYAAYYHLAGPEAFVAQQLIEPGSFDNTQMRQAFEILLAARDNFQPGALGMSFNEVHEQLLRGHAAMMFGGSGFRAQIGDKLPEHFELGTFNIPSFAHSAADPTAVAGGQWYYFVHRHAPHAREAVDFLRYLTSRQMAGRFARATNIPVAVRGAMEGNLSRDLDELVHILSSARTTYWNGPQGGVQPPEMNQYIVDALDKLLTHRATADEMCRQLEADAAVVRQRIASPDLVNYRHVWKPLALGTLVVAVVLYATIAGAGRRRHARAVTAGRLSISPMGIVVFGGPALVLYTVFVVWPALQAFAWSTQRWDGLTPMRYVGLLHFKRLLFESDGFWIALGNNLFIMFVIPAFVLPLSLFLAACINRGIWGSALFRVVFFFPNILGGVTVTLLWLRLYNAQGGLINAALVKMGKAAMAMGLEGPGHWLTGFAGFAWLSAEHLYWSLVPIAIWGAAGFNMLLLLAAMQTIPQSLYEAADMDGASIWRQFWTITMPLIWPVISIVLVFMIIAGMKTFELIWLLTEQMPNTSNHVIATRMVQTMFVEFRVGEATAIAVLLFILVFFGSATTLRFMRREAVEF